MKEESGKIYYVDVNADGTITYPKSELLQIDVGDTIVFHLRSGLAITRNARLRINLPTMKESNPKYINAQALRTLKRPSSKIINEALLRELALIEPKKNVFGGIDFQVLFKFPGSFFFQIEYYDTKLKLISIFIVLIF